MRLFKKKMETQTRTTLDDKLKECLWYSHAKAETVMGDIMTKAIGYGCHKCPKGYEPTCKGYLTKEMQYKEIANIMLQGRI